MEELQTPAETPKSSFTPNAVLLVAVVAVLGVFGYLLTRLPGSKSVTDQAQIQETLPVEPVVEGDSTTSDQMVAVAQTITVDGGEFYYEPNEIRVKVDEPVKIIFNDVEGFHDFVIDEFNVKTPQIKGPNTVEVTFTPDKTGSFEYYCSVGRHREMGMKGTLIVE